MYPRTTTGDHCLTFIRYSDEQFARQLQAATSPVRPPHISDTLSLSPQQPPSSIPQMLAGVKLEDMEMNPFSSAPANSWSVSPTGGQVATMPTCPPGIQPQPQAQTVQNQGQTISCPECTQELMASTTICWRCLHNFYSPNQFPNSTPVQTTPTQPQPSIQPAPPIGLTPFSIEQAHAQLLLMQQILQSREQSQLTLQQRQPQQQIPALPSQPSFVVQGTTASNPITISDSPTLPKLSLPLLPPPPLMNPLPGAWPMTGLQRPQLLAPQQLLNLQNIARQNMDPNNAPILPPIARLFPPVYADHGHHYGNPSADEIKELLANIRPDEEIKTEDKDAIVPGLAPNMRLMKHQQARPRFIAVVNGRWG